MRNELCLELEELLKSSSAVEMKEKYFERLRKSRVNPDDLHLCEMLDCRGDEVARELWFRSRNVPHEDTMTLFLFAAMLAELSDALQRV